MPLSDAEIAQRAAANHQHGLRSAYAQRGDERFLKPDQRSRQQELKDLVQTREGTLELLQDRAVHAVLLAEMGMSWVAREHQSGVNVWQSSGAMARLATYMGEARRTLEALARLQAAAPDDENSAAAILARGANGGR